MLQPPGLAALGADRALHRRGDLASPLLLHLTDAQERGANDGNDNGRDEREGSLPRSLASTPFVSAEGVEDADYGTADDETYEEAETRAYPDLALRISEMLC